MVLKSLRNLGNTVIVVEHDEAIMKAADNIIDIGPENIIGCRVDGKINVDDIGKSTQGGEEKSEKYPKLRIYVEVLNLGGISLEALLNDFKLAFKHYNKFERKAVVTDQKWMHTISPIVDKIFPGIEVKCFSNTDRDMAIDWIKN